MKKNYAILLFLFVSTFTFGQISAKRNSKKELKTAKSLIVAHDDKLGNTQFVVFEKIPLPTQQKNAPEIFYVKDDKPVDRQIYLAARQSDAVKK